VAFTWAPSAGGRNRGEENQKKVDVMEYPESGMEAIWKIEVEDFPTSILVDDRGAIASGKFFIDTRARVGFSAHGERGEIPMKRSRAISEEGFEVEAVLVNVGPFDPNRIALA
jgi:Fumarase C-terminus